MNPHAMYTMQKKPWRKDNQIWRVFAIEGGEVFASSPSQSWRGTIAEFKESFVDAREESTELVIEQNQIWQHIATGIKHATISKVIQSRIFMENLLDGTCSWWGIGELLNEFEQVIK